MTLQIASGRPTASAPAHRKPRSSRHQGPDASVVRMPVAPAAESPTGRVLADLPADRFRVLSDRTLTTQRSSALHATLQLDHLVVGPGGVYLIVEKNWSGLIDVVDGSIRQNGSTRTEQVAAIAQAAARAEQATGLEPGTVVPVVVLERASITGSFGIAGVTILPLRELRGWLCSRTPVQGAAATARHAELIAGALPPATARTIRFVPTSTATAMADHALHTGSAPRSPGRVPARPAVLGAMLAVAAAVYVVAVLTIHPLSRGTGVATSSLFLACTLLIVRNGTLTSRTRAGVPALVAAVPAEQPAQDRAA